MLRRGAAAGPAWRTLVAMLSLCLCPGACLAQTVHWAYSAFFGTGRYTLDDTTETTVLSFAPGKLFRAAALEADGSRRLGVRFRVPFALGAHEFESPELLPGFRFDNVNTFSIVPGVEIDVPVAPRWNLKPLVYIGWGEESDGGDDAEIFRIGLRSERVFTRNAIDVALYNSLLRMGYSVDDGSSSAVNLFEIGLDFGRTLARKRIGGTPVRLYWHGLYTRYFDELSLDSGELSFASAGIDSEWELGAGFGRQGEKLRLWRLKFDRVGIAYRFNSDGQFSGVGIVFKSLFAR